MRKHFIQMSQEEREAIRTLIRNTKHWYLSKHCSKRCTERGITRQMILDTIRGGKIIEFHHRSGKGGILLRGNTVIDNKFVVCVLVSSDRNKVATVYANNVNDEHRTLDWSLYQQDVDVLRFLGGGNHNEETG